MERIDYDLMEGLHKHMPKEMLRALHAMEAQQQKHPNDITYDMHNLEGARGGTVFKCLKHAIEDRYVEGVFLLFDKQRAEHVFATLKPYYGLSPITFEWFENIAKIFEHDLNGVAQLWDAIVPAKNAAIDLALFESIRARVDTAMEMIEPYEQKQRMLRAVEKRESDHSHTTVAHTKKM